MRLIVSIVYQVTLPRGPLGMGLPTSFSIPRLNLDFRGTRRKLDGFGQVFFLCV